MSVVRKIIFNVVKVYFQKLYEKQVNKIDKSNYLI